MTLFRNLRGKCFSSFVKEQWNISKKGAYGLLQLLLGADVVGVAAFLLAAVGSPGVKTSVAFPADHLVAVVFLGEDPQGGLDDSSPQTEYQMEGGFCNARHDISHEVRINRSIIKLLNR